VPAIRSYDGLCHDLLPRYPRRWHPAGWGQVPRRAACAGALPSPGRHGIVAEVCQSFVFDNGAFSIWNKGGTPDVDGYTRWVEDWNRHPGFDWALIPDVIDEDEAANDALLAAWPRDIRGVPVWHLHESLERLQRLVSE